MDLNTEYIIPYLANNSYLYEPRPSIEKKNKEKPLIVSQKKATTSDREYNSSTILTNNYLCENDRVINNERNCFEYKTFSDNPNISFSEFLISSPVLLQTQKIMSIHNHQDEIHTQKILPIRPRNFEEGLLPVPSAQVSQKPDPQINNILPPTSKIPAEADDKGHNSLSTNKVQPFSTCSNKQDLSAYLIEKYIKSRKNDISFSTNQDDHVLSENNTSHIKPEKELSTCKHSIKSGVRLDDFIQKYKSKSAEKNSKKENFEAKKSGTKKLRNYSKEVGQKYSTYASKTRPGKESWVRQTSNFNLLTTDRISLISTKLSTSYRHLLSKSKTVRSYKKPASERSATPNKDRMSEKRELEESAVELLKSHAKHCPNLRKKISSVKYRKLISQ